VACDLVIFDCDGVLIDSELLTVRLEIAMLAEVGIEVTGDDILDRYCGISMKATLADLERRFGGAVGEDFAARHAERFAALCEVELGAMPGVEIVLDRLAGKICVASSSSPARLRHTLALVGLYRRFDPYVFSAAIVARGKPAPDLFLHAAAHMGAEPARCIVVEDSIPGIAAATAAGMTAIGFTGGSHCRPGYADRLRAEGAAVTVAAMSELLPVLAAISARLR
jgi:HAD superfamily hydrolase (TIGR01509 family)